MCEFSNCELRPYFGSHARTHEMISTSKRISTVSALKWIFSFMNEHVTFHSTFMIEGNHTCLAFQGLFPFFCKPSSLAKRGPTNVAYQWIVCSLTFTVQFLMNLHIIFSCKMFITSVTFEQYLLFIPYMHCCNVCVQIMSFEITFCCKRFVALFAFIRFLAPYF